MKALVVGFEYQVILLQFHHLGPSYPSSMVLLSAGLLCISFALLFFTCHAFLGLFLPSHQLWTMGISGLPERIKHGEGTPPDFVGKDVHVDSLSMFYGLIKVRSYRPFKKTLKATNEEQPNKKVGSLVWWFKRRVF